MPVLASEIVARARSQIGLRAAYRLGAGGMDPNMPNILPACDCSGFVAWCHKMSRLLKIPHYEGGEWFSTATIYHDAMSSWGFVDLVPWVLAKPGMMLVYPPKGSRKYGHVGIVSRVDYDEPTRVIHCSKGAYLKTQDAVRETGLEVFTRRDAALVQMHPDLVTYDLT